MTAPDKPDWEAVAEALDYIEQLYGDSGQPMRTETRLIHAAARYALQHGPAIDNAETVWWCVGHWSSALAGSESCWFALRLHEMNHETSVCRMVERCLLPQIGEGE